MMEGDELASLAAEFPEWDFAWWRTWMWRSVLARRKPVTVSSEWLLRATADDVRQAIHQHEGRRRA